MKNSDCFWLAAKYAFGRINKIFLTGVAIAVYCWCAGGGLAAGVQEQLSKPYELIALPGSSEVTAQLTAEIRQIEGVTAASAAKDLTVILQAGEHDAEVTLQGINGSYLQEEIAEGTVFPEETVMPYIVLNKAAWGLLQDKDENGEPEGQDWRESAISVSTETEKISGKICGILDDGQETPKAYASMEVVKKLAGSSGYTACLVQAAQARLATDVSDKVTALGLAVQNAVPPEQTGWDEKNREAFYLLLLGSAVFFYSIYLFLKSEHPVNANSGTIEMLRSIGFGASGLIKFFCIKSFLYICIGFAFGLAGYVLTPQMISPDIRDNINIAFPAGASGLLAGAAASLSVFLILGFVQSGRFKKLCV